MAAGFSVPRLTGGEGFVGEKREETEAHLMVAWMGRGRPGGGSPAMYMGGGHGSSAPANSGEVGKGRFGLGASAFREESIQGLG